MNNEETRILNPQGSQNPQNNVTPQASEKAGSGNMSKLVAASVLGGALGAGSAIAAEHIVESLVEDEVPVDEVEPVDQAQEEQPAADEVNAVQAEPEPTSEHVVVEHHVYEHHDVPQQPNTPPVDEVIGEPEEPIDDPDEVKVVGVGVQENGQGGISTIVGLQSGDEMAIVVDVDSDGTIDIGAVDENGNGQIDDVEWHDISGENFSTGAMVQEYVHEAHALGEEAVATNIDTGETFVISEDDGSFVLEPVDTPEVEVPVYDEPVYDDGLYATNDDMPDYMSDADVSSFEV